MKRIAAIMQRHEEEGISYYYNYTYYFHQLSPLPTFSTVQDVATYFTSETWASTSMLTGFFFFMCLFVCFLQSGHGHTCSHFYFHATLTKWLLYLPNPRSPLNCNLLLTSFPLSWNCPQCSQHTRFTETENKARATQLASESQLKPR